MCKKKIWLALIIILVVAMSVVCCFSGFITVSANTDTAVITEITEEQQTEDEVTPYLFTSLALGIGGGNGEVFADVKNEFTLGFATVPVFVELYSSVTYQDKYDKMTFEGRNYIDDLNFLETIKVTAPTNGVQRYWMARMKYKVDNGSWKEDTTSVWLFDGNGNVIK